MGQRKLQWIGTLLLLWTNSQVCCGCKNTDGKQALADHGQAQPQLGYVKVDGWVRGELSK